MKLKTHCGLEFEIDDEDFVLFPVDTVFYKAAKGGITFYCKQKKKSLYISRVIMNCYDYNLDVDHRDRNIFNNKKFNLRKTTPTQNKWNKGKCKNNKSGYKGVSWSRITKKWTTYIGVNKKKIFLGYFHDKILAAIAYDDAAIQHHGEFAKLNFQLYGA